MKPHLKLANLENIN